MMCANPTHKRKLLFCNLHLVPALSLFNLTGSLPLYPDRKTRRQYAVRPHWPFRKESGPRLLIVPHRVWCFSWKRCPKNRPVAHLPLLRRARWLGPDFRRSYRWPRCMRRAGQTSRPGLDQKRSPAHPWIRTTQDTGKGRLSTCQIRAPFKSLMRI